MALHLHDQQHRSVRSRTTAPRASRSRGRIAATLVMSLALVMAWSSGAGAAPGDPSGVVADWRFEERRGASVLTDSSGFGRNGRIGAAVITEVRLPVGIVHRFSGPDGRAGVTGHVHTVPDHPSLDPASGPFGVTVTFRTTTATQNMVQKGQATVSGGFWKIEMSDGRGRCLFRGSTGDAFVQTTRRLDDGAWHELRCVRSDGRVRLEVDGREEASTVDDAGVIGNTWELAIGGKSRCDEVRVSCDLFRGDMNGVRIDHGLVK